MCINKIFSYFNTNMKNHLISLASLICFSVSTYSQNEENPWLFEFGINSVSAEESSETNYKLPTLSLSRYIFNNISIGINYSENDVNISNEDLYYYSIDGIIKYSFPVKSKFLGIETDPYLFAGYGLSNFGESNIKFASKNTSYGPSFGAGIDFRISKNMALNTGIRYKALDEKNAYSNLQHVVGVKFNFGKGDSDGDGVPDKIDNCPDLPGLSELNGCPDSDGDGIPNQKDQCPNVAGLNSLKGCPDSDGDGILDINDPCPNKPGTDGSPCPDSDGDGLTDNIDNCPTEAGPKYNDGCKLADTDNDDIPNSKDNCPTEPGEKELNGCPKLPILLSNFLNSNSELFFDFDSFIINQYHESNLLNLSDLLKKYQYIKLYIDGYSSYEGETDYNMNLSQNRSNSVKNFLMEKGILNNRLETRAYGEDFPNYPNSPLSERKKNRRVKISIIN